MGQAIGQSLPTAIGITLSPLPIVAVVLMLVTPRGRTRLAPRLPLSEPHDAIVVGRFTQSG
jgi:hypothetical protein